jgi:hypothetical protein
MYSRHQVELHDSFVEKLPSLDEMAQQEITVVWKKLELDPYYRPDQDDELDSDDYVVEVKAKPNDYAVVCQRLNGWDGWQLFWFFEYFDYMPTSPKCVILGLRYQPFEDIKPQVFVPID